jgi:hypothetical protein
MPTIPSDISLDKGAGWVFPVQIAMTDASAVVAPARHHPVEPGSPLNGPTISGVIHPP